MQITFKKIPEFQDHERFLKFLRVDQSTDCWNWIGDKSIEGYGRFYFKKIEGKNDTYLAHRISWSIFKGDFSPNLVIDHTCQNKACVNPDHLREVSCRTNVIENSNSHASKLRLITKCKNGHEYTPENTLTHPSRISKEGVLWRSCVTCVKAIKTKNYLKYKDKYNESGRKRYRISRDNKNIK